MPKALITGITGQDGSYLAELLLAKGYDVHGIIRRTSSFNTERIEHLYDDPHAPGRPASSCTTAIWSTASALRESLTTRAAGRGLQPRRAEPRARQLRHAGLHGRGRRRSARCDLLEAIREPRHAAALLPGVIERDVRQGRRDAADARRRRSIPRSPYACAKVFALLADGELPRGVRACSRATGSCSTTRARAAARRSSRARSRARLTRIKLGLQEKLYLGNLDAKRDWGFAGDYVEAMWLMLQQEQPDDYVIATGETHTRARVPRRGVRLRSSSTGREYVEVDPRYFRPAEVDLLLGDASKARASFGLEAARRASRSWCG